MRRKKRRARWRVGARRRWCWLCLRQRVQTIQTGPARGLTWTRSTRVRAREQTTRPQMQSRRVATSRRLRRHKVPASPRREPFLCPRSTRCTARWVRTRLSKSWLGPRPGGTREEASRSTGRTPESACLCPTPSPGACHQATAPGAPARRRARKRTSSNRDRTAQLEPGLCSNQGTPSRWSLASGTKRTARPGWRTCRVGAEFSNR